LRLRFSELNIRSEGFRGLRDYLDTYVQSPAFTEIANDADLLSSELDRVVYCLWIEGNRIHVTNYESDEDYAAQIEDVFRKFQQGDVEDHRSKFSSHVEMNHVEAGVLDRVALLFPETFAHLVRFAERNVGYVDKTLGRFDREVQFYISYVEFTRRFVDAGLSFCYPVISSTSKEVTARDTYDLALAASLVPHRSPVITNNIALSDPERVIVVSGPNQGGKTTFARTFGQIHYLGALGLPVPGTAANLFLFNQLFTHFEREEHRNNLSGKLQDDLVRVHDILDRAAPSSIVIMNEIFTSTTYRDALFLSQRVYERIRSLDLLCVWVTFIDEVVTFGDTTVSMVSTVELDDPTRRTYKIVRRPADGRAYAVAIAEKYGLTFDHLKERLAR
jgi:DNA mismatch repair protein MutS